MGKIQEALEKVQAERSGKVKVGRIQSQDSSNSVLVGNLDTELSLDEEYSKDDLAKAGRKLAVSRESLRAAGHLALEVDDKIHARQFQEIKRPLIAHAFGKRATKTPDGNIIMITSSVASEGKTFTSINLALSMAQEKDHAVVLVDADVAKRSASKIFGASDQLGLLDLLENPNLPVNSVISPTAIPGLRLLPAGQPRANANELLASARMQAIVSALATSEKNELVLLDTPPLLQTSEAKVLATVAGQIALVVRAEHTSRDAVSTAISLLGNDKPMNLILNQARTTDDSNAYSYGTNENFDEIRIPTSVDSKDMWGS